MRMSFIELTDEFNVHKTLDNKQDINIVLRCNNLLFDSKTLKTFIEPGNYLRTQKIKYRYKTSANRIENVQLLCNKFGPNSGG